MDFQLEIVAIPPDNLAPSPHFSARWIRCKHQKSCELLTRIGVYIPHLYSQIAHKAIGEIMWFVSWSCQLDEIAEKNFEDISKWDRSSRQ